MKTSQLLVAALAASLLLSGCKDSTQPPSDAKAAATVPVSLAAIQAEATGFIQGSAISARTVYVFFDPQCPHCAALWNAAKPLRSQAKFVWIPVALMNKTSEAQGAALLAAKDPASAMDEHEASMTAGKGGIAAAGDIEAQRAVVRKNTALMNRFGFASIPSIVGQHAQTGALVTQARGLAYARVGEVAGPGGAGELEVCAADACGRNAEARGKVVSGQAAAHRQGGRCLRTDSPGFARFRGPSHNSLRALRPLRSNRCDESVARSALARGHEIKQTQAPRNDAPRPARTRLCRDMCWCSTLARPPCWLAAGGTRRGRFLWRLRCSAWGRARLRAS